MESQEQMVKKLEEIGNFLIKIDEKMLYTIEKYDNLSNDHKELKIQLKEEMSELKGQLEIFKLELNHLKIENLKTKNEIEIRNVKQDSKITNNDKFKENFFRFGWLVTGAAVAFLFKHFF